MMTHEDAGHYAEKHPRRATVDPGLADEIKKKATNGEIACAQAEKISKTAGLTMEDVGAAIDLLEIRLKGCQLGLFGYPKEKFPGGRAVAEAKAVSPDLENVLRGRLVAGRLPCKAAWAIASERGMTKMDVSAACEKLKIRVKPCQLGAF
jgi:hypothetical protein